MRRWLSLMALLVGTTFVAAQDDLKRGVQITPADAKPAAEGKPAPVPAYIVAVAGTLLVLAIICTPSRRA